MAEMTEAEMLAGVAFNAYQPDGATWGDVARAVAAKAREMDAARGGTLSGEALESARVLAGGPMSRTRSSTIYNLLDHAAAQGRAIAALEAQNDDARRLLATRVDASRLDDARAQLAAMTERAEAAERSAANAANRAEVACSQLAARDARVKELEAERDAARLSAGASRDLLHKAESALATVRQAVEMARPVPLVTDGERAPTSDAYDKGYGDGWAKRGAVLRAAIAATPAEHPDTAALRRAREVLNPLVRLIALAESVHVLPDAAKNSFTLTMRHWRDIAEVLGDSGPSGGGEACNRCCTRPATNEAVLRQVTWRKLCTECLALDNDPASYVPPDGRTLATTPTTHPAVQSSERCDHHANPDCRHTADEVFSERRTKPTTPPPTAENVCEHGDHPAPAGQRYCSPGCQECDGTECGEEVECAGVCRAVPTPRPTHDGDKVDPTRPTDADAPLIFDLEAEDGGRVWVMPNGEWGHDGGDLNWALDALASALARLRDEPRRAAAAMRERCAEYVDVVANEGGIPAVREAARLLAAGIRAIPLE